MVLKIICLTILAAIFVQDIRSKAVWVWLFPALALTCSLMNYDQTRAFSETMQNMMFNTCFLLLQLLLVTAYFSVKNRQWIWITHELIGWGDVLFLASIAAYLSLVNYILFYLTSLVLILLGYGIRQLYLKKPNRQIPLAGLQAALLAIIILINEKWTLMNLTNDNWLLRF